MGLRKAVKKVTKSVEKGVKDVAHNKYARTAVGYFTGWGSWQLIQGGYAYLRGAKDAKQYYQLTTGHFARQQQRLARDEQRRQERLLAQQREYAYNQRKEQIDELRDRIGAGGTRFRTNKQDKRALNSLWASGSNAETLG